MKGKRQYRISRNNLGYIVYKKKEEDWLIELRFLWPNNKRELEKNYAKTYYHKDDALNALIVNKVKDAKETD